MSVPYSAAINQLLFNKKAAKIAASLQ